MIPWNEEDQLESRELEPDPVKEAIVQRHANIPQEC